MASPQKNEFYFNWLFITRSYNLSKLLFPGWTSLTTLLFLLLLAIALLEQYLIYNVGLISSKYYGVLGSRDYNGFWLTTINSLLYIFAIALVLSSKTYVCNVLYVSWRHVLCKAIHRQYFFKIKYYQLNVIDDLIDNPDQRITQDVDKLCNTWSQIIAIIIVSPFTIAFYTYATYASTGWIGPVGVFLFFVIGTIANKLLMSPIVNVVYQQEKFEGDFRFKHMDIRSHAESMAFLNGGPIESLKTNEKLLSLIGIQMKLYNWQFPLNVSTNIFDYLGSIVSYLIIAVPIFTGKYDNVTATQLSSIVSQTSFVCMYLINCFSQLVDQATKVTNIAGTTHRVAQLIEEIMHLSDVPQDPDDLNKNYECNTAKVEKVLYQTGINAYHEAEASVTDKNCIFTLNNVTYNVPRSKKCLVKGLNVVLNLGTNVLITGSSSSGKTSLLRVLAGLWPSKEGDLQCNVKRYPTEVLFLPQKPYLTDGTLRQQIIYPLVEDIEDRSNFGLEDNTILAFLHLAELENLLDRIGGLDVVPDWNWYDVLSPGEMQRISFVRLFYHHPKIAFLDEATSALGYDLEKSLYKECLRQGITVVSAGHRDTLRFYHDVVLHLDGCGGWTLSPLESSLSSEIHSLDI